MSSWPRTRAPPPGVLLLLETVLVLLLLPLLQQAEAQGFKGIQGDFCRNRKPSECCDDRYDDCSVPIGDTLCYCDQFCVYKDPGGALQNDCCPDYRQVCLGEKPEPLRHPSDDPGSYECEVAGMRIPLGQTFKDNCNECTCDGTKLTCDTEECMVEEEVLSEINSHPRRYGWKASNYTSFWGRKAKEGFLLRTGTFYPGELSMNMFPVILRPNVSQIPREFDARIEWRGRVSGVRDQGWCGASWAFSTLAVTQDRLSILAKGFDHLDLSPQNLLSCARLGQQSCKAGHIERAWGYLRKFGVVQEECYRYESGRSGKVPGCRLQGKATSGLSCQEPRQFKMEPAYRISSKEEDIQWEILRNGPVQAMMKVHRDFFMYKTGVYAYSGLTGADTATHSVRILGWGEARMPGTSPFKYWVVANSWGQEWGEQGYFRIKRGENESGIESFILAAHGRIANYMYGN